MPPAGPHTPPGACLGHRSPLLPPPPRSPAATGARPQPPPPGSESSLLQVPRLTVGAPSGTPTPLRVGPPQPDARVALAPSTPTDPTVWGTHGHRQVRPRRPATATSPALAWPRPRLGCLPLSMRPAQASTPPPAVARGLPHTGHSTCTIHNTPAAVYSLQCSCAPALVPSLSADRRARAHAPPGTRRPHHKTCRGD